MTETSADKPTENVRLMGLSGEQEPSDNRIIETPRATECCLVRRCDRNTRETCKVVLLCIAVLIAAVALITWVLSLTF